MTVDSRAVSIFGAINPSGDRDSFRINLSAPRRTVFRFAANGFNGLDPTLTVRVGGRTFFNDDGGPGLNSLLRIAVGPGNFTARVTVAGFGSSTGNYNLRVNP
jgi:hypothetical protein